MTHTPDDTRWSLESGSESVRDIVPAVALVAGLDSDVRGTGWLVADRFVVTAAAVVRAGAGAVVVRLADGRILPTVSVVVDSASGLAAVTLPSPVEARPLPLDPTAVSIGEKLAVWGYPRTHEGASPLLAAVHLAGYSASQPPGTDAPRRRLVLDSDLHPGHAGSPLLGWDQARVRGMVLTRHSELPPELETKLRALQTADDSGMITFTDEQGHIRQFPEFRLVADLLVAAHQAAAICISEAVPAREVIAFLDRQGIPRTLV